MWSINLVCNTNKKELCSNDNKSYVIRSTTECLYKNVTLTKWSTSFILWHPPQKYTQAFEEQAFWINLPPANLKSVYS